MIRGSNVTNLAEKEQIIEAVRARLHLLVERKCGNFADQEVGELSAYLDQLIVEYELTNPSRVRGK